MTSGQPGNYTSLTDVTLQSMGNFVENSVFYIEMANIGDVL